ncbi:MAG TPA: pyruvate formate-lyase-activating protein [Allosphingosinicella sp.]|jgi:pyruvate formate lyase activating enzyme|nr:pyruvate formate-lyase-activating protein [Allosphingosinicella sp.]
MQQRNILSPLEAASPFELRVDQGRNVSEVDVRAALKSGDVGFLHSFTTGSAVDGPGIRLVAWTASCMFRCQYCHNPDTWSLANGIPVTLGRALGELRKYAPGLKAMNGGFTLSGGEPLMQPRFAAKLFALAKSLHIHTAIETNGYYGDRLSDAELADIDLVILDMKAFSPAQHERVTGMDNTNVLGFCRRLAALRRPMWLRYVLVPGLTDDPQEMQRVADFAASLGVVERTEILPFHQMGKYKWEKLALSYRLGDTPTPSGQELANAIVIFRHAGLAAD